MPLEVILQAAFLTMKILFTADIHIKLTQKGVPSDWAKNRYRLFIEQLAQQSVEADLLVIGGDIFDKLPNMEELEIFYELVSSCSLKTLIFSGNHESLKKDTTFLTYLKKVTSIINPLVSIIDDYTTYCTPDDSLSPIFDIIPYNKLKDFEKSGNDKLKANLLFTHVRGAIEPFVKPEVDLSIFDRWQTVLAGDLHSYENSQRNILYPGSPITTSFHRSSVDTGVILFDTDTHTHEFIKLKLPQLIRKTIKAGDPMLPTSYDHTVYEVEGTMSELGSMEDSELIDKKIAKRDNDTALILDPSMSLQEEVKEYLEYVLCIDASKVDSLLNILNNNMSKIND